MKLITLHLPDWMLDVIDQLVMDGVYSNRAEFIRDAIRYYLRNMKEWNIYAFLKKNKESSKEKKEKEELQDVKKIILGDSR